MKILVINKHIEDEIGGSEIQCDLISKYLLKYGHKITYLAVRSERKYYHSPYKVIPISRLTISSLKSIVEQIDPDVVYWRYNKKSLLTSAMICKFYRSKFIFSIAAFEDVKKWSYYPQPLFTKLTQMVSSRINYIGYRFVDGIVSLRNDFLPMLPDYPGLKRTLIYNSMELGSATPFQWGKPYVAWVASIKQIKNPEFFVKAAERLSDLPVDFLMVGKIAQKPYRYLMNKDMIPPNLHYLGEKTPEDVNGILQGSLFLVHTCRPEGFSNNFIQAWLRERPTVSLFFDPDGFMERHGIGYLSGSFDRMCEQIRGLVADADQRRDMGMRARRIAREFFDPETNVKHLASFFQEVQNSR
jgi:glycosyltransferase involved in cell wall biosynthesis